jgi:hypothetical protein
MQKILLSTAGALGLAFSTPALATVIDDPQVFVCTGCTSSPGAPLDPALINPANFNIGVAGNNSLVAPLVVIIGVPDSGPVPSLSLPAGITFAAAGTYYGLNHATSGGALGVLQGTMLTTSSGSAYTLSGITNDGGGSSENASNWFGFSPPGALPNNGMFNLYAFAVNDAIGPQGPSGTLQGLDIEHATIGSIVVAYGCQTAGSPPTPPNSTCSGGDIGATPFTVAGGVVPAPIVGAGLPGLIAACGTLLVLARRRRQKTV